jgi:hypothetical protein
MAESLILDGVGELYPFAQSPAFSGPYIGAINADPAADLGAPDIVTESVPNLLLDGDLVSSPHAGNRALGIPLIIPGDALARGKWYRLLAAAVSRDAHVMPWTPDGGLTVNFDCMVGSISRAYSVLLAKQLVSVCTLTIPAFPFTRSPVPVTLSAAASPVLIDALDATTGIGKQTTPAGTLATSTQATQGTNAVTNTFTLPANFTASTVYDDKTITALNLSLMGQVRVDVKAAWSPFAPSTVDVGGLELVLTDSVGATMTRSLSLSPGSGSHGHPQATYRTFSADLSSPTIDLVHVTYWKVQWKIGPENVGSNTAFTVVLFADNLTGMPAFATTSSAAQSVIVPAVPGGYRTPMKLDITKKTAGTLGRVLVHHRPGAPPGYDPMSGTGASFTGKASAFSGPHEIWVDLSPSGAATTTVVITATCGNQSTAMTLTAAQANTLITARSFFSLGVLNLPDTPGPEENDSLSFTVSVAVTGGTGMTVTVNKVMPVAMEDATTIYSTNVDRCLFIDPATAQGSIGLVHTSVGQVLSRSSAVSNQANTIGAGTIHAAPGDNVIAVSASGGTWDLAAQLYPRWLAERDS